MKTYQCVGLFAILGTILVSCGGGSGKSSSPTSPSITALTANVSGTWLFAGNITSNTCAYLQNNATFQLGNAGTETDQIVQNNTNLTASTIAGNIFDSTIRYTGTITQNTLKLSVANPINNNNGICTYSIGGGSENTLVDENFGNGTLTLTVAAISGDCTRMGRLPCSITYTGTWRKISSGTPNPTPVPTTAQPTPIPTTANPTPVPTTAPQSTPEPTATPEPFPTSIPTQPTGSPANCQGCCSSHGGVVCNGGVTMCQDGSPLSNICQNKGCNMCF